MIGVNFPDVVELFRTLGDDLADSIRVRGGRRAVCDGIIDALTGLLSFPGFGIEIL